MDRMDGSLAWATVSGEPCCLTARTTKPNPAGHLLLPSVLALVSPADLDGVTCSAASWLMLCLLKCLDVNRPQCSGPPLPTPTVYSETKQLTVF